MCALNSGWCHFRACLFLSWSLCQLIETSMWLWPSWVVRNVTQRHNINAASHRTFRVYYNIYMYIYNYKKMANGSAVSCRGRLTPFFYFFVLFCFVLFGFVLGLEFSFGQIIVIFNGMLQLHPADCRPIAGYSTRVTRDSINDHFRWWRSLNELFLITSYNYSTASHGL